MTNECEGTGNFCQKYLVTFKLPGDVLQSPLPIFITSLLPVLFMGFYLFKSNRFYTSAFSKDRILSSESQPLIDEDSDDDSIPQSQSQYYNQKKQYLAQQKSILIPFYNGFLQIVLLLYTANFVLRGFFSHWKVASQYLVPILWFFMDTTSLAVLFYTMAPKLSSFYKFLCLGLGGLFSLINLGVRLILVIVFHLKISELSCRLDYASYWLTVEGLRIIFYGGCFAVGWGTRRWNRPLLRKAGMLYSMVLLIVTIPNFIGSFIQIFQIDFGLCFSVFGYVIFYALYGWLLHETLRIDSEYWFLVRFDEVNRPESSRAVNLDISSDYIIGFSDLEYGKRIGGGSFGEVYVGRYHGQEVAIKNFLLRDISTKEIDDFKMEVEILSRLRHPNILRIKGAAVHLPNLCLVTEYLHRGSLRMFLTRNENMEDWLIIRMLTHIACGVQYLHNFKPCIIHRDLKSENILVGKNYQVKVSDFGVARVLDQKKTMTMIGTAAWTAPEILRGEKYSEKADVYSFAIIMWEMLTKEVPFKPLAYFEMIGQVLQGARPPIPAQLYVPPNYLKLLQECWSDDPSNRPTFDSIVQKLETHNFMDSQNTTAQNSNSSKNTSPSDINRNNENDSDDNESNNESNNESDSDNRINLIK